MLFLSTPSARRATYDVRNPLKLRQISIHTLREEGDALYDEVGRFQSDFYPRPPRGGRLYSADGGFGVGRISIHALREEGDDFFSFLCYSCTDFYPRPPRGGRLSAERTSVTSIPISIHALREEGDPVGVAAVRQQIISIHALREEGDAAGTDGAQDQKHFYPRPPRGGRPFEMSTISGLLRFLSTPSARRATVGSAASGLHGLQFLSTPSARRATGKDHERPIMQ